VGNAFKTFLIKKLSLNTSKNNMAISQKEVSGFMSLILSWYRVVQVANILHLKPAIV